MKKIYLLLISMLLISMNLNSFDNKFRAGFGMAGMATSLVGSFYLIKNAIDSYNDYKENVRINKLTTTDESITESLKRAKNEFKKVPIEYALYLIPRIYLAIVSGKSLMNSYLKTKNDKLDKILGFAGISISISSIVGKILYKIICNSVKPDDSAKFILSIVTTSLLGTISRNLLQNT